MGKSRSFHLGACGLAFGAVVVLTPAAAVAAEPVQPTAAAWVNLGVDGKLLKGDSTDPLAPVWQGWTNLSSVELLAESSNGGPPRLSTLKLQRTVTLNEGGFRLPLNEKIGLMGVRLRKASSGGSAEWLNLALKDPTVKFDEVRASNGASTATEVMEVSFSRLDAELATQTAEGIGKFAPVPAWYDLQTNFRLDPQPPPGLGRFGGGTTDKL